MGCVPGISSLCLRLREVKQKLSNKKLRNRQRERSISVSASAPNHMLSLTSGTKSSEINFNKSTGLLGEIEVKVGCHVASVPLKYYPILLALFEKALKIISEEEWNANRNSEGQRHRESPRDGGFSWAVESHKNKDDPLGNFEEKCPPGGANAVVLYTTTLELFRKAFEDCNNVRNALESYGIRISVRDVSIHVEFGKELRKLMGGKVVTVPRVFIKGRYIGGVDEVLRIHGEGKMADLIAGIPTGMSGRICDGCAGVRFVPCSQCSGSCKLVTEDNLLVKCPHCNENGLIHSPNCC